VIFTDHTQLILSSDDKLVLYIGKNNERTVYPLLTALEDEDVEMSKRLKYTREILAHMMISQQQKEKKL
jgi:polo-like kinase 1